MTLRIETRTAWELYSEFYPTVVGGASARRVVFARGWMMASLEALMAECSAALQFPPRHSANWEGFSENLHDLEWIPEPHKTLVIFDAEKVLKQAHDRDRMIFFGILLDAPARHAAYRIEESLPLSDLEIILQCDAHSAGTIQELLARAKTGRAEQP